jgi:hypothetical protein
VYLKAVKDAGKTPREFFEYNIMFASCGRKFVSEASRIFPTLWEHVKFGFGSEFTERVGGIQSDTNSRPEAISNTKYLDISSYTSSFSFFKLNIILKHFA